MVHMVKNSDKINDAHDNHIKEHELKDKPVYIKVSDETRSIIDKYKEKGTTISDLVKNAVKCYDDFNSISPEMHGIIENYKEDGESDIKFIERAIKYYGDQKALDRDLWMKARDEMKMMLIGKTTFNQLIHAAEVPEDALDKPWRKNVAIDLILWLNESKPLKSLSMEEIINAVMYEPVVNNVENPSVAFVIILLTKQTPVSLK